MNQETPPYNRSPSNSSTPYPPPPTSSPPPAPCASDAPKAYELARAGEFPVRIIRVGAGYHVPTAELLKVLGVTPLKEADPGTTDQQMTG